MFSGDFEPVASEPTRHSRANPFRNGTPTAPEADEPRQHAGGVPPREMTPNLPPSPDTRQRATNQGVGFDDAAASTQRLGAFAVGASGRPARPRSPRSPAGR